MKIFAKRRKRESSIQDGDENVEDLSSKSTHKKGESKKEEEVISYFSPKFVSTVRNSQNKQQVEKRNQPVEHDIEALLAMDPADLNSKQRRVLRRHQQREGISPKSANLTTSTNTDDSITNTTKQQIAVTKVEKNTPEKYSCENGGKDKFSVKVNNSGGKRADKGLAIEKDGDSSSVSSSSDSNSIDDIFGNDNKKKETPNSITIEENDGNKEIEQADGRKKESNEESSETNEMNDKNTENECTKDGKADSSNKISGNSSKANLASSIIAQLQGLNSKERRKLLRKLKAETGVTQEELAIAEEEARRVADENRDIEKKEMETLKNNKRKCEEVDKTETLKTNQSTLNEDKEKEEVAPKKKKKKSKIKDWSDLPEEERKRREEQREKQAEAARLRESGEITPGRHPLNSERRRANRRKPGRAGKIARMVKDQKDGQRRGGNILGQFDANGYLRRKEKRHGKDLAKADSN